MSRRMMGGHRARSAGSSFEQLFELSCNRSQVLWVRIPNGSKTFKDKAGKLKVKNAKSPFDYLCTKDGKTAVLDCKTLEQGNWSYSAITRHQLDALLSVGNSINAGYLVWYRKRNAVVWLSCFKLRDLRPGESLTPDDGLYLGTIENFKIENVLNWVDNGKESQLLKQQRLL